MSGPESERSCRGGTRLPRTGCVKRTMAPAEHGVSRGSDRKTEDPHGHSPPGLPYGALRVRVWNSCWLPRFRTIIKYLLSFHCVQRGSKEMGPELNSLPFLSAAALLPQHPWPPSSSSLDRKGEAMHTHTEMHACGCVHVRVCAHTGPQTCIGPYTGHAHTCTGMHALHKFLKQLF